MSGSRTMRATLWALLGVAVIGCLTAWWFATHKRVEAILDLPRTGEARRNPLFALKVALEKDDVRVHARRRLQLLPGATGTEQVVRLDTRDTLVLFNDPRTLSAAESSTLLEWVDAGGHLVVRTPPLGLMAGNTPATLLDALQLKAMGKQQADCEGIRDAGESDVMFCASRRFTLVGANPSLAWGDLKNGYVFARVERGAGSVDVLADLDFLATDGLEEKPSFALARQLLAPNYRSGTVHLVYAAEVPSLWMILVQHSWMAWAPLLLALAAWLWRRMERFGPTLVGATGERRSLLEHIHASGEHTYRYGYAHLLYGAVRNAFLARLRRRDPQAAALEGEPQLALLAERFRDVPADQIRDALMPPFGNDHAAFRSRIATLIRLRNRL